MEDLAFLEKKFKIYPASVNALDDRYCFMANDGTEDLLCVTGNAADFPGEAHHEDGQDYMLCRLTHEAAEFLRAHYSFTVPAPVLDRKATFGVGDRLGLAAPGHLRVFSEYEVLPILAQQSMRELTLTHRKMADVIDTASFAVFRAGYRCGFGADGDHLKKMDEIGDSIACGCSMITLDCSEYIDNDAAVMSDAEIEKLYQADEKIEKRYLGRDFELSPDVTLTYDAAQLHRIVCVYSKALGFIEQVYAAHIAPAKGRVSFEISIDETLTVTSPLAHYFVANELKVRGIRFDTIAPRFPGEFQKGIEYIGDLDSFRREIHIHAAISKYFGYKLSVHSGSDKFSVFPIVAEETEGRFHVKTSGTNWLEAVRVVALNDAKLFRAIYALAYETFEENRKSYHVTPDLSTIPDVEKIKDSDLITLLDLAASRQVLHISYGKILETPALREGLFRVLREHQQDYSDMLYRHIGHHASALCIPKRAIAE